VYEAPPARLRRLALASLALLYLVVTTGALVRLTGSGLGCENWPRCGSAPFPTTEVDVHAAIEFGNRVVAFFAVIATLVTWLVATRTRSLPRFARRCALATFLRSAASPSSRGCTRSP
jgi:cytochrome c oxidase assembly protein subunit 15